MYLDIPIEYKIDSLFKQVRTPPVRSGEGKFPFKAIQSISLGLSPQTYSRYTKCYDIGMWVYGVVECMSE